MKGEVFSFCGVTFEWRASIRSSPFLLVCVAFKTSAHLTSVGFFYRPASFFVFPRVWGARQREDRRRGLGGGGVEDAREGKGRACSVSGGSRGGGTE